MSCVHAEAVTADRSDQDAGRPRKILFLITESWYFLSHRLPLARACRDLGWEVVVATRVDPSAPILEPGVRTIPIRMRRSARNPVGELGTVLELFRILRAENPDILHAVGLKPVLYGGSVARLAGIRETVSALAGMGYVFISAQFHNRMIRLLLVRWMHLALRRRGSWLILQNEDDVAMLTAGGVVDPGQVRLIRGSGVDLARYCVTPEPDGVPVFAVVCRMLKDKGVREVVLAARELARRGIAARVWLVGEPDLENPASLSCRDLAAWHAEGCVEWLGVQDDIPAIWSKAHVCLLPSYREGVAKAMIEAAACGRPIITNDVPGCREVVRHGVEGLLVPAQDWRRLADAMAMLATDRDLRLRMGAAARRRAEKAFGQDQVVAATLGLYAEALDARR